MHTEFFNSTSHSLLITPPNETDTIVLAGDIGCGFSGLTWARNMFQHHPIVYINGNHEYYDHDIGDLKLMRDVANLLEINLLENTSVVINGVRFLGCTLWTSFNSWKESEYINALTHVNDYKRIKAIDWWKIDDNCLRAAELLSIKPGRSQRFHPVIAYLLNMESIAWLDKTLSEPFDGKSVVVTHHSPSRLSFEKPNSNHGQVAPYAYVNKLDGFVGQHKEAINLWCHGHIHHSSKYIIEGVPVRSNPRGYPLYQIKGKIETRKAQANFNDNLLIKI